MKDKSILIVDDDQGMLDIIDKYVRYLGYQTRTALNGLEAIDILQEEDSNFGLLITDLVMPDLSGVKLIKIVKKKCGHMKIIACSGYGEMAGQWADDAGADVILYKPLEMYKLEKAIDNLI
ncbi:MAG: response regulator [Desulfobacterales bacterium]|nr:response regulator [Desulfobacterales bacterium]